MELPEDVMAEILSGLAVKTLLRFKCMCRQWRRLISSRSFAYLQLNRSVSNPTILVQEACFKRRILHLDPINFAPAERSILELDSFTEPLFVGSINGLVCLETYFQGPSAFVILNPSTGFFKGIPTRPLQPRVYFRIGFGWDPIADDYKVFRIYFGTAEDQFRSLIEVWSVNLQYWRAYEVDCNDIRPWLSNCNNLMMEGFTYFLVRHIRQLNDLIACIDVKKEAVGFIPIPRLLPSTSLFLMNWKGTLAAASLVESTCSKVYQVWTMDDDRESWRKKFTFEPKFTIENTYRVSVCYNFSTSINGTQVLLQIPGELILYDLETRESRKIKSCSQNVIMSASYLVETLLSIPSIETEK